MKILNRYILKDFIKSFIISMFVIYSLLLIQLMIKLLDKFLGKGFSFSFLGELLFYNTAWILATTIPMAVLVSSILIYGKLSSNNEIIGFKASGINTIKIIKPALVTSIFICLATIYFSCNILPKMNFKARKLNHELAQKRPDVEFEESIFDFLPLLIPYLLVYVIFYFGFLYIWDKDVRNLFYQITLEFKKLGRKSYE